MITRWIVSSLLNSVTDTAERGWYGLKTETKILSNNIYNFVAKPSEQQIEKTKEENQNRYQITVDEIKKHQQERDKIASARRRIDKAAQRQIFCQYQQRLSQVLMEVNQELTRLNQANLPILWRNQIKVKCAEKNTLHILLAAITLTELKILAERQQPILAAACGTEGAVYKLIDEIKQCKETSKLEIIPPVRRF